MHKNKLRKYLVVLAFCVVAVVLITFPIGALTEDETFTEEDEVDAAGIVLNAGAIGAVCGVFLRVYVKWKDKERQLKKEGKLSRDATLEFNWRYGHIAIFTMAIELIPTVIIPALTLGSMFTSGNPFVDFFNGLFRGAAAASLITIATKHIRPINTKEG